MGEYETFGCAFVGKSFSSLDQTDTATSLVVIHNLSWKSITRQKRGTEMFWEFRSIKWIEFSFTVSQSRATITLVSDAISIHYLNHIMKNLAFCKYNTAITIKRCNTRHIWYIISKNSWQIIVWFTFDLLLQLKYLNTAEMH